MLTSLFRLPPFASSVDMDGERSNKQDKVLLNHHRGLNLSRALERNKKVNFFLTDTPVTMNKKKKADFQKHDGTTWNEIHFPPHNSKQLLCLTFKINPYVENIKPLQ